MEKVQRIVESILKKKYGQFQIESNIKAKKKKKNVKNIKSTKLISNAFKGFCEVRL